MTPNSELLLGVAKECITPVEPVRLAGYAFRDTPYQDVREDILVRVHYHQSGDRRLIFVYGDLLWWGSDFVEAIRIELQEKYDIRPDEIFFFASHNHSGPGTGRRFIPELETCDSGFEAYLKQKVVAAILNAGAELEPVTVRRHDGICNLNVYRRKQVRGVVEMRPNYAVPADRRLLLLSYQRSDGATKALTASYACHANVSAGNSLHPDYPGIALRLLDEAYPGSTAIFLQGCAADLRPNSVLGGRFTTRSYDEAVQFALDFFEDCLAALSTTGKRLKPDLAVTQKKIRLPFDDCKTENELQNLLQSEKQTERQWAEKVLANGNCRETVLEMGKIRFADALTLYTFAAEVSQEYSLYARQLDPDALAVSCTNGMVGYIPTAMQIKEGGYEPKGSPMYFALSGHFPQMLESIVHAAMKEV